MPDITSTTSTTSTTSAKPTPAPVTRCAITRYDWGRSAPCCQCGAMVRDFHQLHRLIYFGNDTRRGDRIGGAVYCADHCPECNPPHLPEAA